MPFPGDLTTRTVTGTFRWGNGAPQNGYVTFTPSADLVDSTGNVIVPALPVTATLYGGSLSISLLCTDNADISPSGWSWIVTVNIAGGAARTPYNVLIATGAGSIDLAKLAPVTPGPPVSTLYGVLAGNNTNTWLSNQVFSGSVRIPAGAANGDVLTSDASGNATWQPPASSTPAYAFPVSSYGAKGDGKMVTDGAMTSGSAALACITSTPFAAGDVGKAIMVKGAGPTGITTLVTTVSGFTDSGHLTLAATASTTISGATVMWATDDTAAFQAAVNAATTYAQAHGGYAEVVVPPAANRFYGIAGALSHANAGNAQITLPVIPTTADTVTIALVGTQSGNAIRHWLQTVPQLGGSCMVSFGVYPSIGAQASDISANGQSAMIGGPTGPNGYGTATFLFSNMCVVIKGMSLVTTHSNYGLGYGAAWLWGVDEANIADTGYGTTGVYNNGNGELSGSGVNTLSSGGSIGIGLPATSNQNNVSMDRVTCGGGYTYGLLATEHSDLKGCHIFYCWAALCPVGSWHDGSATANTSSHKIRFTQVGIEGCAHSLFILGAGAAGIGPFIEGSIDSEGGVSWSDDGNGGLLHALGEVHLSGTTGGALTTSTGTGLTIVDERQSNGPGAAWSLTVGTAFQNTQWRWANVLLSGGSSLTGVQLGTLRGGSTAPTMTNCYTQAAGALPAINVRVPPGGWLEVTGTGSPTAPTATVVYD